MTQQNTPLLRCPPGRLCSETLAGRGALAARKRLAALGVLAALGAGWGCGGPSQQHRDDGGLGPDGAADDAALGDAAQPDGAGADADAASDAGADAGLPCPQGLLCVDQFPYHDDNDTSTSESSLFDAYGCAPSLDESGPERIYRLTLVEDGFLSAVVPDDVPDVDIDLHLLGSLDPNDCIDRGNFHVSAHLSAGTYYLVADTWVTSDFEELSGPYALDIGFLVPTPGDCSMTTDVVERITGEPVTLPAVGAMVLEAHLVTVDDAFAATWPSTQTENIEDHYALSYQASQLIMARNQPWAPQESCEFGQSASGLPLPVVDEAWYVNMLWSSRPPKGTRMILRVPGGGPAVVVAAGYETGPGDTTHLGGTTEEAHFYLGTAHLGQLELGFAADQNLPLGPIDCGP